MFKSRKKVFLNRGFTLIELLVVIAVIGILASVILASLSTAKAKSVDASIKSALNSLRSYSLIYYENSGGTFGGVIGAAVCPSVANTNPSAWSIFYDPEFKKVIQNAGTLTGGVASGSGATAAWTKTGCGGNSSAWAVAVVLKTSNTQAWCVDSSGNSRSATITADLATQAFNSSTYICN